MSARDEWHISTWEWVKVAVAFAAIISVLILALPDSPGEVEHPVRFLGGLALLPFIGGLLWSAWRRRSPVYLFSAAGLLLAATVLLVTG